MSETKVSPKTFLITWVALMLLALLSFGLSYLPLGRLEGPLALGIAAMKGALVVLFFMELIGQRASNKIVLITGVVWLLLLATLTTADVLTRPTPPLVPPVAGELPLPQGLAPRAGAPASQPR
jgi:cytochrome c oxidase subunit 4